MEHIRQIWYKSRSDYRNFLIDPFLDHYVNHFSANKLDLLPLSCRLSTVGNYTSGFLKFIGNELDLYDREYGRSCGDCTARSNFRLYVQADRALQFRKKIKMIVGTPRYER